MDLYSIRTVAFCCCFGFLLMSCDAGDVCLPTWNSFARQFSIGGTQHRITSLQDCIVYCEYEPECVAVDYDSAAHPPCWVHTNPDDLVGDNVYNNNEVSVTQFVINRTSCTELSTGDCQLNWTRLPGVHSSYGEPYDFWTEYDCFTFCRYTSNCVAADFDVTGSTACWIHTSYDDLSPDNTYYDSNTVVQYQMNRTCPTPTSADNQVGRCVGQPIRNGTWCPPGKEINIVAAAYKVHPLCCHSPTDISDPPDSGTLVEFDVFVMDDTAYISELLACDGRNACSVISKSFNHSRFINNSYCPQQSYKTNFVSLTYACVELGHTNPSTTKSVTSFQFPTESFLSTQGATCLLTWTRFTNRFSIGGTQQPNTDLKQCIEACQLRSDCLAVDFDTSSNLPCWMHTNPDDLVGDSVYDSSGDVVAQYVINRTCITLSTGDCQVNWIRLPGVHSSNGQPSNFWTENDCFSFCRYTSNCVAADFDVTGSTACWIHTSYDDLTSDNTYYDSSTVVQYQMNRTCPTSHSGPTTTPSLTSFQSATEKTFPMEGTHQMTATPADGNPAVERVSSQSNNRDALILAGIAIALAIIAILAIAIFAVLMWYRHKKQLESMNHAALNPLYGDYPNHNPPSSISGVSSSNGRYPGSPFKGIKTITYPEDDTISS